MAEVKVDLSKFKGDIQEAVAKLEPAARAGLIEATKEAYRIDRDEMSELIYNKPETEVMRRNRETGRIRKVKLWKRTGNLLRGERMELPTKGNLRGRIYNNIEHAEGRHNLQYPAKTPYQTLEEAGTKQVRAKSKVKGRKGRLRTVKVYKLVDKPRPDRPARWRLAAREKAPGPAFKAFQQKFEQELSK